MSESLRTAPAFFERDAPQEFDDAARPTAREWRRHATLLLLTAVTATLAGVALAVDPSRLSEPRLARPDWWFDYLLYPVGYYLQFLGSLVSYALAHPAALAEGATFAAALLAILLAHESGHYVACRLYGVRATLPFFIPAPPPFPAGTFGAFIKIRSPIPNRRALFDIGVAGPLAGFAVALPVALVGVLTARPHAAPLPAEGVIYFNDPLLLRLLAAATGVDLTDAAPNPFYFAAWVGLLVTSLNLLPVGQLDGGHATYALFGARPHRKIGRGVFAAMSLVAVSGCFSHGPPGGFLSALLPLFVPLARPPRSADEALPLGRARAAVALLTLLVFLLSFLPFPVTIR